MRERFCLRMPTEPLRGALCNSSPASLRHGQGQQLFAFHPFAGRSLNLCGRGPEALRPQVVDFPNQVLLVRAVLPEVCGCLAENARRPGRTKDWKKAIDHQTEDSKTIELNEGMV